jgi:uncharacterized protein DUF5916
MGDRFGRLGVWQGARWAAVIALILRAALPTHAQEGITVRRNLPAVRLSQPPVIDGDLSDPCWQEAAKLDRWVDVLYSTPVPDQTIGYLGYDDKYIYVAFHAFDSQPSGIIARETKRGTRFTNYDDFVAFAIDPFHTHQFRDRAFFIINPIGTQFAHLMGDRATKLEWEGKWQAASKIVADGWTGEMAIPWEILSYPSGKAPVTCGINMDRFQQRTKIHSLWCNYGPQELNELEGHWVGIRFPPYHPQLSLLPYASIGWDERTGGGLRAGLDARYTPTPLLTLVGTVNPDFQNVEEAVEGIDFSYGERFVPDRRPFFQEGAGIYNTGGIPGRYWYSQRVPAFDVGANLYGKLAPRDTIGVLAAVDFTRRADWLLRGRHAFGETSNVNVALINRDDEHVDNRVAVLGEDFRRVFWNIDSSAAFSWVGGHQTGRAGNAFLYYASPRWFAEVAPHFVSPGFRDDLGFIPFVDYKGVITDGGYSTEWRKGQVRSMSAGWNTNDSHHYDGRVFRQVRGAFAGLQTRSDYALDFDWNGGRYEEFNDSVFSLRLRARASDPFHNIGLGYSWGRRADHAYTFITPSATWRFGQKLTIGLASSLLYHTEDAYQHIITFNYDFSPQQGIGGRVVAQTEGTNAYLSYRRSGYGGTEMFLILGDPNAASFTERVVFKVVWAI